MARLPALILLSLASLLFPLASTAQAYEYIEHAYFADQACWHAKHQLAPLLDERPDDFDLRARYLALALTCPDQRPTHYCIDGEKAVSSHINRVGDDPWDNSDHSITLGDYSALVDHVSRLGPVTGLSGAEKPGFLQDILHWFAVGDEGIDGVLSRVTSKTCIDADDVPWAQVGADVDDMTHHFFDQQNPHSIPPAFLSSLARTPPPQGPTDPVVRYTISNPHYLDLVLRNHNHFGTQAFDSWVGHHSTSLSIASQRCEDLFSLSYRDARKMARPLDDFQDIQWRDLAGPELAERGCAMLAEHTRLRLLAWADRAHPDLVAPLRSFIDDLARLPDADEPHRRASLQAELLRTVSALKALVFEGTGLHFLQDGLAGGHIRTIRDHGGLGEARYNHNYDNAQGVSAVLRTRSGDFPFVAFGDAYMMGHHRELPPHCQWEHLHPASLSKSQVTACLLRHQRGLLTATASASLLDWAFGGLIYEPVDPEACQSGPVEQATCNLLPLTPVATTGSIPPHDPSPHRGLHHGDLPVPPPNFDFESLVTTVAFDVAGSKAQYGLQLTLHSQLDRYAHWLTSYRAALLGSYGLDDQTEVLGEFSYNFHFRLSARLMLEAGAGTFVGFDGIGDSLTFKGGLFPSTGLVILPEGWLKAPLDLSVSFRLPMTFFTSQHGFFRDSFDVEAFWLQIGLGLAFM